jgi:hypothetical protein
MYLKGITVVLGGDHSLALPLIVGLEANGYIVITSVSTPEAVEAIEHKCNGYVRALVLDSHEVNMRPPYYFIPLTYLVSLELHQFSSALSLRPFLASSPLMYQETLMLPHLHIPTSIPSYLSLPSLRHQRLWAQCHSNTFLFSPLTYLIC